jgi:PKD repeat protein
MKNYITISDYDTDLSRDWLEVCTIEEDQSVRWECDCNEPYITDRIEFKVDCADFAFDSTGLTITSSDLVIDWGDGTTDERFTATVPSHTYAKKDIYKVKVKPYNSSQANWFVF